MNKYKEALNELSYPLDDSSCGGCKCGTSDCQDCKKAQAVFTLEQLINEHFDNPPLKFEKLKEGTWVWDNYYKIYVRVTETLTLKTLNSNDETFIVRVAILTPSLDVTLMSVVYDKYRFYKYEVEDNA